jgi:aminopeptidase
VQLDKHVCARYEHFICRTRHLSYQSSRKMVNLQRIDEEALNKVVSKFGEFMQYCQKLKPHDTYLIVNRNSPVLARAAQKAAENNRLSIRTFDLAANKPYNHFPQELITLLREETPKAGLGLFDYSHNPGWNLKEVGARIELLHQTIEKIPISWAHSPGITLDMATNGPLQCNYRKMAEKSEKLLQKLQNIKKIHITAPGGTDVEVKVSKQVKFDTDCIIVPPNVYGQPGKFGNLPVGEVWSQKGEIIKVVNSETGKEESQNYPVKQKANGKVVCDVSAGGYEGKINPGKPITVHFENGVLTDFHCEDQALDCIREEILASQKRYGLPTVLEEVGIGLNERARITGNMLEDEKLRGTCHLAPGNVRCHVDMLIDKPTITVDYLKETIEIMRNGSLAQ